MKKILAYISIIGMAAFAGNMINIGLSYGLHWQSLSPLAFRESFQVDFPLLLGPTIATLMPAFFATLSLVFLSKENKTARRHWLMALVALLFINVQTLAYHLPLNLDFMEIEFSVTDLNAKLNGWLFFHWIRVVVAIVAVVQAIIAFQKQTINN